jgi:hypothetical protein
MSSAFHRWARWQNTSGSNPAIDGNVGMSLRPAYLKAKLTRPIATKDGGTLRTVGDARAYMLALPAFVTGIVLAAASLLI